MLPPLGDLARSGESDEVLAHHVVRDTLLKVLVVIQFVLPAVSIHDDIACHLPVLKLPQLEVREALIGFGCRDLLGDLEPPP
jgi:hypothetical protein